MIRTIASENLIEKGLGAPFYLTMLASLVGIVLVAIAFAGGRAELPYSRALFWLGMAVSSAPPVLRLLRRDVQPRERVAILLLLNLFFYLVKILYSPTEFQFGDEFSHWRSTANLLVADQLFAHNPLLAVAEYYPGLHSVTAAIVELTGLPIFESGLLVIGVARTLLIACLYYIYLHICESSRIAALGAFAYMANPNYLFFSSYFIYQSLALPIAFFIILMVLQATRIVQKQRVGVAPKLFAVIAAVALLQTHHVTNIAFLGFLGAWVVSEMLGTFLANRRIDLSPLWVHLFYTLISLTWIAYVATIAIPYLSYPITAVTSEVATALSGDEVEEEEDLAAVAELSTGPIGERLLGISSVGLVSVSIVLGAAIIWLRWRKNAYVVVIGIASFSYGVSILVRLFSERGAEFAGRSWTFVFFPAALVIGLVLVSFLQRFDHRRWAYGVVAAVAVWLFLGGIASGWPPHWARLPGPFLVGAFERSVNQESLTTASWMQQNLGLNNRIATDRTNFDILASYGMQDIVRGLTWVFWAPALTPGEEQDIRDKGVDFFVVDERMTQSLPQLGIFYEPSEPNAYEHTEPMPEALLEKFAEQPLLDRIYDSGNMIVYDVGDWVDAP